jgi:hypothetical protein
MKLHKPEQETHAGKSVQMACQMLGIPLSRLADHLGISRQGAHNMQSTKRINSKRVESIAEFFNMTTEEFLNLPVSQISTFYRKNMTQVRRAIKDHNDPRYKEMIAHSDLVEKLIKELE